MQSAFDRTEYITVTMQKRRDWDQKVPSFLIWTKGSASGQHRRFGRCPVQTEQKWKPIALPPLSPQYPQHDARPYPSRPKRGERPRRRLSVRPEPVWNFRSARGGAGRNHKKALRRSAGGKNAPRTDSRNGKRQRLCERPYRPTSPRRNSGANHSLAGREGAVS